MKLQISFSVDTAGIPAFESKSKTTTLEALENVAYILQRLHLATLERKLGILANTADWMTDEVRERLIKDADQELELTGQIFSDYKVDGELPNGKKFTYHAKAGDISQMTWHKKLTNQ